MAIDKTGSTEKRMGKVNKEVRIQAKKKVGLEVMQ